MMCEMSASEFRRWAILEQIEPFGEYGNALRTGLLCSLIANIHRAANVPAYSAEDFMPEPMRTRRVGPEQTPEQMFQIMMLVKAHQDTWLAAKKQRAGAGANGGNDTGARTV